MSSRNPGYRLAIATVAVVLLAGCDQTIAAPRTVGATARPAAPMPDDIQGDTTECSIRVRCSRRPVRLQLATWHRLLGAGSKHDMSWKPARFHARHLLRDAGAAIRQ